MNRWAGDVPAPEELEPLATASLGRRFPHLRVAMDSGQVSGLLQSALFGRTGFVIESCPLPKADVADGLCRVQYSLRVRTPAGDRADVLVLGVMFTDAGAAAHFERAALAPLAARLARQRPVASPLTAVIESLDMAVSVFPVTDMLPTLVEATDHGRMTGELRSVLAADDTAELTDIELVRLRRTPRCVLRYRFGSGDHHPIYGKVGSAAGSDHVRRGLDTLASRILESSQGTVLVPRMLGQLPDLDLALFQVVPGARADIGVAAERDAVVAGAARAAASIHTSGVDGGALRTLDAELERAMRAVQLIQNHAPALARWLAEIVQRLAGIRPGVPAAPAVAAHGDFTLSQLLLAGSQVGVLDFDGLCQAEPELDLGRFTCYLWFALAKAGDPAADELSARFLASYREFGGGPVSELRVRLNAIASLVLMAVRSWQQLKPRRLQLVCGVLEREVSAVCLDVDRAALR